MGMLSLLICLLLLIIELVFLKKTIKNPITLFYTLWTVILLLSNLNLFGIKYPSNESFLLITLMNIFLFIGDALGNIKKNRINKNSQDNYLLSKKMFNFLFIILLIFTLIDVFIILKNYFEGVPLYDMRRWRMGTFGVDSNPILNRRSFLEEAFRSVILAPFENIIFPFSAYIFFNSDNRKDRANFLLKSILILVLSSIAGGGGRLSYIYFFGCYLLGFAFMNNSNLIRYKKYKKYIRLFLILGFLMVFIITSLRTYNSFLGQTYKYFAMSPTLLSEWLPVIKNFNHTYGFLTFFGVHSYLFRALEKIGLSMLVPGLYTDSFNYLLLAEKFRNIGYGLGNAFVSPLYYFYIDGGVFFVCLASMFFGFIISKFYNSFIKNINIRSFALYCLIMYAVFITFIRIQTSMPNYILSIVFIYFFTRKEVDRHE